MFSHIKDSESLNETVKNIIAEYEEKNGTLYYSNEKQNENDNENDNEVSCHDSSNESSEPPKMPKISKANIDAFFESIWQLYPIKKGKGQVSDSKRRTLYAIGYEQIEKAIDRYLQELKKDEEWRKPQNGSTFFNSGYVDYLDENFVPDQPKQKGRKEKLPGWFNSGERTLDDDEVRAIQQMMSEEDQAEADQLRKELEASFGRKAM